MTEAGDWDHIVVGGGLAGVIVAVRLSESGRRKVLLIEAGRRRHSPILSIPAGETMLVGDPRYDWQFETEPDPTLGGRRVPIPRGRLLGGSNAINGMLFVRGQRDDYDEWARRGCAGWDWTGVLPWFRRLETWEGETGEGKTVDSGSRGRDGPIRITLPRQREPLCDIFLEAARQAGHALNPDYNSGDQEGFGYYQCTQKKGRRFSVLDGYLDRQQTPNLKVETDATVCRLILDGRRCSGVEYADRGGTRHIAHAGGGVVLSAGVIGSPKLLELSGIGDPARLRAAGVAPLLDRPAVGENFRDHFATRLRWRINQRLSFNERTRGLALGRELLRYALTRRGVLSMPIAIGYGFVRSSANESCPDLQFHFAPASYGPGSRRRLEREPGMTIGVYPSRPDSAGSVHLRSADPFDPPAIATRFLDAVEDRRRLIAGMRIARTIAAAPAFDAVRGAELSPGEAIADDAALLAHIREEGGTSFHPVGTCRMGGDADAVVDPQLRVRGIAGLHVVDASVMPTLVSGNTQAATMMIAERGAALIGEASLKAAA